MKKRIIAAALAAVVALNLCSLRPKAEAATVAVIGIGIMAWQLLGVMNGNYDGTAKAIGELIESGVDAFTNPDSTFQTEYVSKWIDGWRKIYYNLTEWVDDYTITVSDDGKVRMKYSQYLELCDLVGNAYAETGIEFHTDIPYIMFKATPDLNYLIDRSIMVTLPDEKTPISYAPIFYSSDKVFFPDSYFSFKMYDTSGAVSLFCSIASIDLLTGRVLGSASGLGGGFPNTTCDEVLTKYQVSFAGGLQALSTTYFNPQYNIRPTASRPVNWYLYDGKTLSPCTTSDILESNCDMAFINCKGEYLPFVNSITSYVATSTPLEIDDLSKDLSQILDKTKDPTLEVDTDPAIATPADAVTVTDIPGTADVTISQLREKTNVDIDIPSVISTKFPFCIPFDFIRIIGVLCADPVAPVFRIPISTDPENLKGFEGNQTIGELPEDFTPMFEIDEELVLDLSAVPLVQPICYTVFIISFVVLLIFSTNKMINH